MVTSTCGLLSCVRWIAILNWLMHIFGLFFFFFQAEDGIRDLYVTGVQTCALPISGFGSMGGAVRARTDFQGRARIAWLPPGDFRLEAQSDDGRRGRATVTVTADRDTDAVIHVR